MASKDNKNRKYGRGARSPARAAYKATLRVIKNTLRKRTKHVRNHPNDKQAAAVLKAWGGVTPRSKKFHKLP